MQSIESPPFFVLVLYRRRDFAKFALHIHQLGNNYIWNEYFS